MSKFYGNLDEFLEDTTNGLSAEDTKFFARNPGTWGNKLYIAVAGKAEFTLGNVIAAEIGDYKAPVVNDIFEYDIDEDNEFAIVVLFGADNDFKIVETFVVSSDINAKDYTGKSKYITNVINRQSSYLFVQHKPGEALAAKVGAEVVQLEGGVDNSNGGAADYEAALELFDNKEEIDIDIVIASEDGVKAAQNLGDLRKDCLVMIGIDYDSVVGKKAGIATTNSVDFRDDSANVESSMFSVLGGNYKYQYDRFNDKNRWINIAGDIAGLRAQTSSSRASWWASAGLERGVLKNVIKLAFNPNQAQRDQLYKNGINPIVSFPGQGTVMWGQKTLLSKPSSFDRVNVRGLFNTLERSLSKMAKYQVMEFNDNFTRNRIVSMIKPFLSSVQAGRGIEDFLVVCDTTNNTPDVISRNQLIVDVYIKPTYVAEFILLRFTNAGTNSFAEVMGG